jgi:hypothetical protein
MGAKIASIPYLQIRGFGIEAISGKPTAVESEPHRSPPTIAVASPSGCTSYPGCRIPGQLIDKATVPPLYDFDRGRLRGFDCED